MNARRGHIQSLLISRLDLTCEEAAFEADKRLGAAGITREMNRPRKTPSAEQAAHLKAHELPRIQAIWERARDSSLTEAEAITVADARLRASHPGYAAVRGRRR